MDRPSERDGLPALPGARMVDFDIVTVENDGDVMLVVRGALDIHTAAGLEAELARIDVRTARNVLVDLDRIEFVDLSGLRPLLTLALAAGPGLRVSVTTGSHAARTLLRLSGLGDHFNLV